MSNPIDLVDTFQLTASKIGYLASRGRPDSHFRDYSMPWDDSHQLLEGELVDEDKIYYRVPGRHNGLVILDKIRAKNPEKVGFGEIKPVKSDFVDGEILTFENPTKITIQRKYATEFEDVHTAEASFLKKVGERINNKFKAGNDTTVVANELEVEISAEQAWENRDTHETHYKNTLEYIFDIPAFTNVEVYARRWIEERVQIVSGIDAFEFTIEVRSWRDKKGWSHKHPVGPRDRWHFRYNYKSFADFVRLCEGRAPSKFDGWDKIGKGFDEWHIKSLKEPVKGGDYEMEIPYQAVTRQIISVKDLDNGTMLEEKEIPAA